MKTNHPEILLKEDSSNYAELTFSARKKNYPAANTKWAIDAEEALDNPGLSGCF